MSATLFTKIKELVKSGVITTRPVWYDDFGSAEVFFLDGKRLSIVRNFVGNIPTVGGTTTYFRNPTDILAIKSTGEMVMWAEALPLFQHN